YRCSNSTADEPVLSEGLIPVSEVNWRNTKDGYIDTKGKLAISPQFASVGDFHDGLAVAQPIGGSTVGYIDHTGKLVIPAK
ncbi:WG repeat-containing protein, partial [Acinetobacter baumannii]